MNAPIQIHDVKSAWCLDLLIIHGFDAKLLEIIHEEMNYLLSYLFDLPGVNWLTSRQLVGGIRQCNFIPLIIVQHLSSRSSKTPA